MAVPWAWLLHRVWDRGQHKRRAALCCAALGRAALPGPAGARCVRRGCRTDPEEPSSSTAWKAREDCQPVARTLTRTLCAQGLPQDPEERNAAVFWKAKKWALHIAARMFTRYATPDCVSDERSEKAFAQLWAQHCAVPFLEVSLELLSRFAQARLLPRFSCCIPAPGRQTAGITCIQGGVPE